MKRFLLPLLIVTILMCASHAFAGTTTWDDNTLGLDGWTKASTNTTLTYKTSGGNSGGYIEAAASNTMGFKAPSAFTGNYADAGYDAISFDFKVFLQQLDHPNYTPYLFARYSASYNSWTHPFDGFSISDTYWKHYELPINPLWTDAEAISNGWIAPSYGYKSFAETMGHVSSIGIMGAYPSNVGRTWGLDNFTVGSSVVPEPASMALFILGGAGMMLRRRITNLLK